MRPSFRSIHGCLWFWLLAACRADPSLDDGRLQGVDSAADVGADDPSNEGGGQASDGNEAQADSDPGDAGDAGDTSDARDVLDMGDANDVLDASDALDTGALLDAGDAGDAQVKRFVVDNFNRRPLADASAPGCNLNNCGQHDETSSCVRASPSSLGICPQLFCLTPADSVCPSIENAPGGGGVLRLDAELRGDTFVGYSAFLVPNSAPFALDPALDCLTFWVNAEKTPPATKVEISLKESEWNASNQARPPAETFPKANLSQYTAVRRGWCKVAVPVVDLVSRGGVPSGGTRPLELSALSHVNLLLTQFRPPADASASMATVEIDDLVFESCAALARDVLCPPPL